MKEHYEVTAMPFDLINAPATFKTMMYTVLRQYLRKSTLVFFFYDILIYSKSIQHGIHLQEILILLQQHKLYLKPSK